MHNPSISNRNEAGALIDLVEKNKNNNTIFELKIVFQENGKIYSTLIVHRQDIENLDEHVDKKINMLKKQLYKIIDLLFPEDDFDYEIKDINEDILELQFENLE